MATLNPYLNFDGNTEDAFNFYKSVFGGTFTTLVRYSETPDTSKLSEFEKNKIMHVALPLGKGNVLMGTDVLESMGQPLIHGNDFILSLSPESEAEAFSLHQALSEGGKVTVPMGKASWGDYFGMLTDKFGIQWMVNYAYPKTQSKVEEEELSNHEVSL
jgi:PhnB protein